MFVCVCVLVCKCVCVCGESECASHGGIAMRSVRILSRISEVDGRVCQVFASTIYISLYGDGEKSYFHFLFHFPISFLQVTISASCDCY